MSCFFDAAKSNAENKANNRFPTTSPKNTFLGKIACFLEKSF